MATTSPIDQIKERLDIVDVISTRVKLQKAGRTYKGLCPFHAEKTPSFVVFPDKGNYHCFGCGSNGDVFAFTMKTENLDFSEALRVLAERAGVVLQPRRVDAQEEQQRARLYEINRAAAQFYANLIRREAGHEALQYLHERGVSDDTVDTYQLGWAPDGYDLLTKYLLGRGWSLSEVLEAGLAIQREGSRARDLLRARVTFPIRDLRGNITGFGGRTLADVQPKYLNSPQTAVFDKGGTLYGLDRGRDAIRETGMVVVVEGYMDVLIAHQSGMRNVVASLGTTLTERQVLMLKRLTRHLVLALDPDSAGQAAAMRGMDVARQVYGDAVPVPRSTGLVQLEQRLDAELRIARLPLGRDPDEVIRADPETWHKLIGDAKPVIDEYFDLTLGEIDLQTPNGGAEAARRLLPLIGELRDELLRRRYLQKLSHLVGIPEQVLVSELARLRIRQKGRQRPEPGLSDAVLQRLQLRPGVVLDEYYVELALQFQEKTGEWLTDLLPDDMGSTEAREVLRLLCEQTTREGRADPITLASSLPNVLSDWLMARVRGLYGAPMLYEAQVRRELGDCAREIRRRNLRWQTEQLVDTMQRSAGSAEAEGEYRARIEELLSRLHSHECDASPARVWRSPHRDGLGRGPEQ